MNEPDYDAMELNEKHEMAHDQWESDRAAMVAMNAQCIRDREAANARLSAAIALLEDRSCLDWDRRVVAFLSRSAAQPPEPFAQYDNPQSYSYGAAQDDPRPEPTLLERIEEIVYEYGDGRAGGRMAGFDAIRDLLRSARGAR